ncbi:MAG: hypothetical protein A2Y67_02830 [Candidatus Buchananbacteria bacterium RBG_13_39_9]|uniref:Uncharacterized protein n=1 Tax=Candidatus Buchananbacteria bacterium RBG_13_39_9 TaxID=1797531 RepID=A0A1G1XSM7_9BACT|nr:MAG: hypothetical protein A2Y67_02830 [Candidatus Buchananbacteria bacterium RBG_13_39_9]
MKRKMAIVILVFIAGILGLGLYFVFADTNTRTEFPSVEVAPYQFGNFDCMDVLGEIHEVAADINYKSADDRLLWGQEFRQQIISCLSARGKTASKELVQYYIDKREHAEKEFGQSCNTVGFPEELKQACLEMSKDRCHDN